MKDFKKYKTDISLPDFLINNFKFVPVKGSSFCYPKLKSLLTGQEIVIRLNKLGYYTYFDIHDDRIKGCSIFDFLQKELSYNGKVPDLYSIAEVLDNYIKEGKVVAPDNSKYYLSSNDCNIGLILKEVKPLEDRSFLYSRGLSDKTIDSSIFKGIFEGREYIKGGSKHVNIAIKLFNKQGVAGLSQRNAEFKGCLLSRFDSLAISKFEQHKPIDIFLLAESMIDAASHYQMFEERLQGKNIVYFSTEGSLTAGQLELFQSSVNFKQPENIVSLFDRDIAGQEYNLKLFGNLVLRGAGQDIKTEVLKNKTESTITLNITMPSDIAAIKEKIYGQRFFSKDITGDVKFSKGALASGVTLWEIVFPRTYENIDFFVNKLREFRLGSEKLFRDIPLTNDFNDDLRAKAGIHTKWAINKIGNKEVGIPLEEKKINLKK